MRFPLCVAFLTVCIVAWECTASDVVSEDIVKGSEGASEAAVTATTTTAAPTPDIQVQQPLNVPEQNNGEEEDTQRKPAGEHGQLPGKNPGKGQVERDTHQPAADAEPEIQSIDQPERREAPVNVAVSQAASQTTTTTKNLNSDPLPERTLEQAKDSQEPDINSGQAAHAKKPGEQIHQGFEGAEVSHGDAAQNPAEGQKLPEVQGGSADLSDFEGPSTTEVHSATTTATVEKPSGPKGDTEREQSNGHAKKETPDLEVKDAITRAQPTTHTVTKTGGECAQSTSTSSDATGDKKEQKASLVPSQTTETTEKKDNQAAITPGTNTGEKEIIQEQNQKSTTTTTAEPTTSTVAPTTTLQKGFKIPKSLDKTDGSKSSSLLFAFATFITFTVIAVAPVY